jgi:hypothetical protein
LSDDELVAGDGVAAGEQGPQVVGTDLATEPQGGCERTDPATCSLTRSGVVGLRRRGDLAQVVVGGTDAEPADVQHRGLPRTP